MAKRHAKRQKRSPAGARPTGGVHRERKTRPSPTGGHEREDSDLRAFSAIHQRPPTEGAEQSYGAMLRDSRLSHPANAGQKADLLSGLQHDYGNAYVQRVVDRERVRPAIGARGSLRDG